MPATALTDPIIPLHREWRRAEDEWRELAEEGRDSEPPAVDADDRALTMLCTAAAMTPRSLEGVAAQIEMIWCLEGPDSARDTPNYLDEIDFPANRMLRAIYSFATGGKELAS